MESGFMGPWGAWLQRKRVQRETGSEEGAGPCAKDRAASVPDVKTCELGAVRARTGFDIVTGLGYASRPVLYYRLWPMCIPSER